MRLGLPIKSELAVGYDSLYYISGKLSAILVTTGGDFAVEVDPQIGSLSNYRESR